MGLSSKASNASVLEDRTTGQFQGMGGSVRTRAEHCGNATGCKCVVPVVDSFAEENPEQERTVFLAINHTLVEHRDNEIIVTDVYQRASSE